MEIDSQPITTISTSQTAPSTIQLFESETKRLKQYFKDHPEQIIGCRIIFSGNVATVKYFGHLLHQSQPSQQLWVGVEWDELSRGKHNGTVNGHTYFICPDRQGSLLKYDKIEFGYKLLTGYFKRYFKTEQIHHAKNIYDSMQAIKLSSASEQEKQKERDELGRRKHKREYDREAYVETLRKNKVMVEFVGFDEIWNKLHMLDRIQNICVANGQIQDLGGHGELSRIFPNLTTLSFEDNLLFDWNQVYLIGHQLSNLTELIVTDNLFRQPQDLRSGKVDSIKILFSPERILHSPINLFSKLKSLVLIHTNSNWKTVFNVLPAFPVVETLVLCFNDMNDTENIVLEEGTLQTLKFLNLESTHLKSFEGIKKFKDLKSLQRLILNKNALTKFGKITGFNSLKSLSLQHNWIDSPSSLAELSALSTLQYLNIKHNPISNKLGNGYVRMRTVAQFPNLKVINGADLKKYERKDCEVFYLRETFNEYFTLKKVPDYDYDFEDFTKWCEGLHPKIERLIKKYGNPFEPQKKEIVEIIKKEEIKEVKKPGGMVEIKLHFRGGVFEGRTEYKRLPLSWTLSNLKNLFSKTMKIPVNAQKLSYVQTQGSQQYPLQEDHKTLSFYNFTSQSTIFFTLSF